MALHQFLVIASFSLGQPQKLLQPATKLRNLQKWKTHNIKIHRTKYLRYKIKNVLFFLFLFYFFLDAKMMHYCMYCNTQASESFLSPHIGRFLWFCHLVWSKTVVSPSVYTSLQWRKNETHIISMAPSLGISQGCKSILKQSNLRGVFFTFSFCNTWIIKKD